MKEKHSILCVASLIAPALLAQNRPNIIYIMSDDHGSQAISSYGGILKNIMPTPNIDRIGNEGVRFESAFCTNSISTPSRAVILTGKYSQKNGVFTINDRLDPNQNNIAKILTNNGYNTAIIGKWHLGSEPQGFNYFSVLPGQGDYYDPKFFETGDSASTNFERTKKVQYMGYSTDIIADNSIKWLENRDKSKPFMLMCQFKAPHRSFVPAERHKDLLKNVTIPEPANIYDTYQGKGDYSERLRQKLENLNKEDLKVQVPKNMTRDEQRKWAYQLYMKDYLRCVAAVDENVGKLLDYLDKNGLTENTIVVYTSDQGFFMGEHGWFDKRMMYEESLHMPLLIRYPKEIKKGQVNKKDMVMNLDFAPTLLDFAGVAADKEMQGESFRSILDGKRPKNWRASIYYRYWMHEDPNHHVPGQYGIRTERYKLIFFYNQSLDKKGTGKLSFPPSWELFDLKNDPTEMHNLYGEKKYSKIILKLKSQLKDLKKQYGDEDKLMD
jgi:arylsulfatase A-like enzyme